MGKGDIIGRVSIMQAYLDGEEIEIKNQKDETWEPLGNEERLFYRGAEFRIKPKKKVRPFCSILEFAGEAKVHGPYIHPDGRGNLMLPVEIGIDGVYFYDPVRKGVFPCRWDDLAKVATWQDGTPCGVIEG